MWELERLAEQALRAEQIWEDLGLEDEIGKLVDYCATRDRWFDAEHVSPGRDLAVEQALSASLRTVPGSQSSVPLCRPEDIEPLVPPLGDSPMLYRDGAGSVRSPDIQQVRPLQQNRAWTPLSNAPSAAHEYPPPARESQSERSTSYSTRGREAKMPKPHAAAAKCNHPSSARPPGTFGYPCGLDGCPHICATGAELRRHSESLANCEVQRYMGPRCTRQDGQKRHIRQFCHPP
ncbi:hypothetical protein C8R47DRAFT_1317196, partial [Mycena vitilis]